MHKTQHSPPAILNLLSAYVAVIGFLDHTRHPSVVIASAKAGGRVAIDREGILGYADCPTRKRCADHLTAIFYIVRSSSENENYVHRRDMRCLFPPPEFTLSRFMESATPHTDFLRGFFTDTSPELGLKRVDR